MDYTNKYNDSELLTEYANTVKSESSNSLEGVSATGSLDRLIVGKKFPLEFDDSNAYTIVVIGNSVILSELTHPNTFREVKEVGTGINSNKTFKVIPKLSKNDAQWFLDNYSGTMGDLRRMTHSGRIWKNEEIFGEECHILAFWTKHETNEMISKILSALKINDNLPIYVWFVGQKTLQKFNPNESNDLQKSEGYKSKLFPHLTSEEIEAVMHKAHEKSIAALEPWEQELVKEIRGTENTKRVNHGYETEAEYRTKKTFGDSVGK